MNPIDQNIRPLESTNLPRSVKELIKQPKNWLIRGENPNILNKRLCVVGSRDYSGYGKDVCQTLIAGLSGFPISIVSGMALGIDSIAHQSALDAHLHTIAFPGSSLEDNFLYPRSHLSLAHKIINSRGCLISGFPNKTQPLPYRFPQRNEYMSAWCDAVLVIEARLKSGTLITAKRAIETNKDVLVVPGSIFSEQSEGTHYLLSQGAIPVRSSKDILQVLGLIDQVFHLDDSEQKIRNEDEFSDCTEVEMLILKKLRTPASRDTLYMSMEIDIIEFNQALTLLELKGYIVEKYGLFRRTS